jgi:hypothetical protein
MLLFLFALSIFAGLRGWFPWSILLFGVAYCFTVFDYGAISHSTSLSSFGINATAGSLLELLTGFVLGAMTVFNRS